jgi:hypothetical protein
MPTAEWMPAAESGPASVPVPRKVGWLRGTLYFEQHPLLEGAGDPGPDALVTLKQRVAAAVEGRPVDVDWDGFEHAFRV